MKNFPQFPSPKSLAGHPRWALLLMILASIVLPAASPSLRAQTLFPFRYEPHEGGIIITGYTGTGGDVAIPGTIDGLPVTTIGFEAFASSELTSVVVPESVTSVQEGAFAKCLKLVSVSLGNNVREIEFAAFAYCPRLQQISVGVDNPAYRIDGGSLVNKSGTILIQYPPAREGSYVVPEGVTDIGEAAFADSVGLTNVTLPKTLNSIGSRAFQRCTGLSRVSVPDGVRWINEQAFEGCSRLEQVNLGQSLEYLAHGLFRDCTALMELTIPDSVEHISTAPLQARSYVFENCAGLRKLHLGRGVTFVPYGWNWILWGCTNLTSITVADDHSAYRTIDGVLFSRDKTSLLIVPLGRSGRYDVPTGVLTIEDQALRNCKNLVEVVLPDSLVSIGDAAFAGCPGIRQITIPNSVTHIGGEAFADCTALTSIVVPNRVGHIRSWTFVGCISLSQITILGSVTYVDQVAFGGCPGLVYVKFSGIAPSRPSEEAPLFDGFLGPVNTTVLYLPGTSGWGARLGGAPTAPWLPAIGRPATAADQHEGSFGFPVEWAPNRQVTVEACSDLTQRDWQPVGSLILDANGIAQFSDPDSASRPTRLYRLRSP